MAEERHAFARRNRLLAPLSVKEFARLDGALERVDMTVGEFVGREYTNAAWAYFPETCVLSMIRILQDGSMVEVGVVGYEGMAGVHSLDANAQQPYRIIVQHPGAAWRIPSRRLREEFRRGETLQDMLLAFSTNFLLQVSQTAACNRLHTIEQRLARWLLMMRDRTNSDELKLTQEFISHMLGTRVAGVNEAVASLKLSALINHERGSIQILDCEGLEAVACECYRFVRNHVNSRV